MDFRSSFRWVVECFPTWLLSHSRRCFCCSLASLAPRLGNGRAAKRGGHLAGTERWACSPLELVLMGREVL